MNWVLKSFFQGLFISAAVCSALTVLAEGVPSPDLFGSGSQTVTKESVSVDELIVRYNQLQSDPEKSSVLYEQGKERARFCFNCHGEDGNSRRTHIPNLAHQNPTYLFTQFEKFVSGQRENYVMSQLAPILTADERIAIAVYFSQQEVVPRVGDETVPPDPKGKVTYETLCFACHGKEGHGDQQYPRIAGQPYDFLTNTLISFKNKEAKRKDSPMTSVIQHLSEDDLRAVASWVTHMP